MVQAVRGMRDVLPVEAMRWRAVESQIESVLHSFAYEEVQLPLLEFTELFSRGVGEATDIVEKEMYTLEDRDGTAITLRPEGTAGCVRALQQHGLLYNQTQRVYYRGPMFRYERPQKGRYRQFYQIGAEAFGMAGPDVDVELLAMCLQFWRALGIEDDVKLQLNTLGSAASRLRYRDALVGYLERYRAELDEDSQRRLETNPLRVLDSKVARTREILVQAPKLPDYVDAESRHHFDGLCRLLDDLSIAYQLNETLVRGLDYYTDTVFEWVTEALGSQGAVCAGGRYDGLVERLGGKPTAGAGFALGLERALLLHEQRHSIDEATADIYCCAMHIDQQAWCLQVAQKLRDALPELRIRVHAGGGKLKNQLRRADQSGARWAIVIGEDEAAAGRVTLKPLRDGGGLLGQRTVQVEELINILHCEAADNDDN